MSQDAKMPIAAGAKGLILSGLDDMWRFANYVVSSGFAPKGMESPAAVLVAMQAGAEVGLSPMQAIQNIAVINGRPAMWGDATKGLVDASGLCESFEEGFEGTEYNDGFTAWCRVRRVGRADVTSTFSVADAKRAGLWDKPGPWKQYPKRMLKARARAFALRDAFPDVLKGLRIAEEEIHAIDVTPSGPGTAAPLPANDIDAALDAALGEQDADILEPLSPNLVSGVFSYPKTPEVAPGGANAPEVGEPGDDPDEPATGAYGRIQAAVDVSGIDGAEYDRIVEGLGLNGMDPGMLDEASLKKLETAIVHAGKDKAKAAKGAAK